MSHSDGSTLSMRGIASKTIHRDYWYMRDGEQPEIGRRYFVAHVAQISRGNAQANALNSTDLAWSRLVGTTKSVVQIHSPRPHLSHALILSYTATACYSSTQYQDPMWSRRHMHRSPMFVEIFGGWWHSQRHASNHAITLANSGWIPAR